MRHFIIFTIALMFASPAFADRYEFDKSHTNILFRVNHLGFSDMIGVFTSYDGNFTFDPAKPEASTINVTIRPAGIRTSSEELDKHLQGADFFNSGKFPEARFVSTSVKKTGDNTGDVTGDLTMLGVTKPVVLKVRYNKGDYHPKTGDFVAGFSAETVIRRSEFGMNYGVPMVGDEVRIIVETEGVNQDRKKAEEVKKP